MARLNVLPEQAEPPEQPALPTINFAVAADGATLSIAHGNGLFTQLVLTAATMQQLCKVWLESRKELMKQQQLVADVMRTKR